MIFHSRPTTIGAIMVGTNRNGTRIERPRMFWLSTRAPARPSMNSIGTAMATNVSATPMAFQNRASVNSVT